MYISAEGQQGRIIIVRLKPGVEIVSEITAILKEKNIKAGYIPVIIGGFKKLRIISMRRGDDENQPVDIEREYREPLEYFGMGTIAEQNGEPSLHVHLTAAQTENKSLAGHLVSGEVVLVTEVVIVEVTGVKATKKPDREVFDLPLLDFE